MSKRTYIIDGYNAIHRIPEWAQVMDTDLARAREMICSYCAEWLASRRDAEKFIVVFDGDSKVSPFSSDSYRGVRILYTESGETADARIISLVEDMAVPRDAVVVSDDGEVMRRCGMAGAETTTVRKFVGVLRTSSGPGNRHGETEEEDGLTPAQRNKITNDLKREWGIE